MGKILENVEFISASSQNLLISESLLNSEPHNLKNYKKFNVFLFFFIEAVWKEMFKMINCRVQNKSTGQKIGPY